MVHAVVQALTSEPKMTCPVTIGFLQHKNTRGLPWQVKRFVALQLVEIVFGPANHVVVLTQQYGWATRHIFNLKQHGQMFFHQSLSCCKCRRFEQNYILISYK